MSTHGALLIDAVVSHGDVHVTDPAYQTRRQKAANKWGDGTALKIRIEPEEEAIRLDQYRHLFGHVFQPVIDTDCGHTKAELCLMAKAQFMPDDGRKSLTELTAEEMADFIKQCEVWLHTEYPDAFALYDQPEEPHESVSVRMRRPNANRDKCRERRTA